ncbi:MAG: translocation/assembly module TamB domain-containing protein [Gammaproteobacteria bacterium]|nr:translocation/assembly module TamB domain-containing protein [Gammaproteobacteria bacterium]
MKRPLRLIIIFLLLLPVVVITWLITTQSGLNFIYQQTKNYFPASFSVAKFEGKLIGPITLRDVEYRQDDVHIKTRQLQVDWHPGALFISNINISRLHIQSLQIILPETPSQTTPTTASPESQTLPDINLPWHMSLQDVQIDDVTVSQGEQNVQLQQIKFDASTLLNRINIKQLSVRAEKFLVEVNGDIKPTADYTHDLNIGWQITLPTGAVMHGSGQLAGNLQHTQLTQQLTGPLQLTLNAELNNLLAQLNWQASVDVSAVDTAQLLPDWPAMTGQLTLQAKGDLDTAIVSGKLQGYYADAGTFNADFKLQRLHDSSIQIDQLALQLPGNKTQLNAQGNWQPGDNGGDINLTLNWKNLRWPMQDTPWFDSAAGHGTVAGTLDHYQITLATRSPWPQAAHSYWQATAEGDLNGLTFHHLSIKALDGEAIVTGRLDWSPSLTWKAKVQVSDINPAVRWPDWPGKLHAKLSSHGYMENDQLVADADISQLNGLLRGYPLTVRSRIKWRDGGLDIPQFDFHSGTAQASAHGRLGENLKLDWQIEASNLAELYPKAQGQFKASGQLAGQQDAPLIKATFNGKNLRLPDYQIGHVEGEVTLDWLRWQQVEIRLAAQALKLNGYVMQSLDVTADAQQLRLDIIADEAAVHIGLKGELDVQGWQGHIERADITTSGLSDWQLKSPAALSISQNTVLLESLCWQNAQQASVCSSLQRNRQVWKSSVQLNQLPLQMFGARLPPDLTFDGVLDAHADLQWQAPDQLHGQVHISLPAGAMSYPLLEGERSKWGYRGGNVDITLDEQGLSSHSELAMNNGDHFSLDASLPGAKLLALDHQRQAIHAQAELTVHDLGLVEALMPELQDLKGEVAVKLTAAGTLAKPRFGGQAHLLNASFRVPRLGLNIEQFNLRGQSDGLEKINFSLAAHSGDGSLNVQGQTLVDSAAGWPTGIHIKGDRFEISRIPEARVLVSPDLQVRLQHHNINVTGKVDIPFAKLQPKDITMAANVSDDVVIVGGEETSEQKWLLTSKIRLTLGDRVNFFGFGFEGRLGGSLLLEDEPGELTTATGEISIPEGRYRAYGQRLDVERGRLLFTGGPLTNPGLDLRAVRQVNNVTAGVNVRGTLTQPQLELFSIPAMSQTDMLSYLILGRPMETTSGEEGAVMAKAALALGLSGGDHIARKLGDRFELDEMRVESSESGDQASLVVGRYLSPKIYVSYGVGLVEAINSFTVRYQISERWQLKAESGAAQGADIFYTIER